MVARRTVHRQELTLVSPLVTRPMYSEIVKSGAETTSTDCTRRTPGMVSEADSVHAKRGGVIGGNVNTHTQRSVQRCVFVDASRRSFYARVHRHDLFSSPKMIYKLLCCAPSKKIGPYDRATKKPGGPPKAKAQMNTGPDAAATIDLKRYTEPESIWAALETKHVRLPKMSWLIQHAKNNGILPRRQELPEEALEAPSRRSLSCAAQIGISFRA